MIMNSFQGAAAGYELEPRPLVEGTWHRWVQKTSGKSRVDPPVIAWAAKFLGEKSRTRIFSPGATQTNKLFPHSTSHAGDW